MKNLIKGEIYMFSHKHWDNKYLELYDENKYPQIAISKKDGKGWRFSVSLDRFSYSIGEVARIANVEEKQWLLECIKQNKFVPKEEILTKQYKFIVGKWYKNLSGDYIAKAIENSKIINNDNFYHGDYINRDRTYCRGNGNSWLKWNDNTCECSLNEIQQYLPKEHVDKLKLDLAIPRVELRQKIEEIKAFNQELTIVIKKKNKNNKLKLN